MLFYFITFLKIKFFKKIFINTPSSSVLCFGIHVYEFRNYRSFLAHMSLQVNFTNPISFVRCRQLFTFSTSPLKILGQFWPNLVCMMTHRTRASKVVLIKGIGAPQGGKTGKLGQTSIHYPLSNGSVEKQVMHFGVKVHKVLYSAI